MGELEHIPADLDREAGYALNLTASFRTHKKKKHIPIHAYKECIIMMMIIIVVVVIIPNTLIDHFKTIWPPYL